MTTDPTEKITITVTRATAEILDLALEEWFGICRNFAPDDADSMREYLETDAAATEWATAFNAADPTRNPI